MTIAMMSQQEETNSTKDKEKIWQELQQLASEFATFSLAASFKENPQRASQLSLQSCGLFFDYSKSLINEDVMQTLVELAESCHLADRIHALMYGDKVNVTENRPALHTALRNNGMGLNDLGKQEVSNMFAQMDRIVTAILSKEWRGYSGLPITDVVNIGIGGSDLGPFMACRALQPYVNNQIKTHFISNVDAAHVCQILKHLHPSNTLIIVSSKSFGTLETLTNAQVAKDWCRRFGMKESDLEKHFVAVTSNVNKAVEFGIKKENILPMWDWVGGRYSLWSAIGLPIALNTSMATFKRLLQGASEMDQHFLNTPLDKNMPVIHGLLAVWYRTFMDEQAQLIIPYEHNLRKFPAFLQQLEMESNGKSVDQQGKALDFHTMGVLFGEAGTNTQHSFHQCLHQGTKFFPVDFIISTNDSYGMKDQHDLLFANCLSQSKALMMGKDLQEVSEEMRQQGYDEKEIERLAPHKVIPGNRPSTTLVLDKLTPERLGALTALYEHKVYVQSVIWDINAFDQWGVELGKVMSSEILTAIQDEEKRKEQDQSTNMLLNYYLENTNLSHLY